jgi:hypothetical protein
LQIACHCCVVAKDALDAPTPPVEPTRLESLRARLKEVAPAVKVERRPATADTEKEPGSKACVLASWGRHRVSDVAEQGRDLDACECRVIAVVIAHHEAS